MSLREEVRECPATYGLVGSWAAIYVAMLVFQGHFYADDPYNVGRIDLGTTDLFGSLSWAQLVRGEAWRLVTATFLHGNLLHILMNGFGMVSLGRLMEPWYGGRQFLAICLGLGGSANLLGLLMRQGVATGRDWLQSHGLARVFPAALVGGPAPGPAAAIHTIGGSTVILGLIGLCLVAGWRSRTRVGAFLRDQMALFLVVTALIGVVGSRYVDNYAHAGGAIAGAALGFFHRRMVRTPERGRARRLALGLSMGLLAACFAAQYRLARADLRLGAAESARMEAWKRANEGNVLLYYIGVLRPVAEPVIVQRFGADYRESARIADPGLLLARHPSIAASLAEMAELALSPQKPRPLDDGVKILVDWLDRVDKLRPRLDDWLGDPTDLDAVVRDVDRLTTGSLDSHDVQEFRTALGLLETRARRLRDDWAARANATGDGRPEVPPAR